MAEGILGPGWIELDGEPYQLVREDILQRVAGPSARRWSVERLPLATKVESRPDVRPGVIPGEYVITKDDWSKGISGRHENYPNTVHYTVNINHSIPGALRAIPQMQSFTDTTTIMGGDPVFMARHGGISFILGGRLCLLLNNNELTEDKDFGAGVIIRDAVIYEGSLRACFGDIALASKTLTVNYKLWKRTTALSGTMWTQDDHTGAVTFVGAGLNDMTLHSTNNFFGDTATNIRVQIDASAPTPDTFKWSADNGSTWTATGVACSTSAITLSPGGVDQGIRIVFAAVDGHTIDNYWNFSTTQVPHAHHLAVVRNRLWRGVNYDSADTAACAEVSSIDPGDDPEVNANWGPASPGYQVGDQLVPITDLNALGERLLVSKEDGLSPGDEAGVFSNVLPQIAASLDNDNGKNTLVQGATIVFPYRSGRLLSYLLGDSAEIGLGQVFADTEPSDNPPSAEVSAMCMQGNWIWAATKPSLMPRAIPTKSYFYDQSAATYTDVTSNVTDGSLATVLSAAAMQTNDYIYLAYSAAVYGVFLDLLKQNANQGVLTIGYPTAVDGSSNITTWANLPKSGEPLTAAYDGTSSENQPDYTLRPFRKSGAIYWGATPSDWIAGILNAASDTVSRFWIRISVSVATETGVPEIAELRIITGQPTAYIFRGRPRGPYDRPGHLVIWESWCRVVGVVPAITAMNMATYLTMPHRRGETLMLATRNKVVLSELPVTPTDQLYADEGGGIVYEPLDDAGMPELNKQWNSVTIKGRTIDANHTVALAYRMDEATSWTSVGTATSSPTTFTLSSVQGRAMQRRYTFTDISGQNAAVEPVTEINEVEIVFRPLPTYKNVYRATVMMHDGQPGPGGGMRPKMATQLSTLEATQGAGAKTLVDATRRSKTVTVQAVSEMELYQDAREMPVLLVELVMCEV